MPKQLKKALLVNVVSPNSTTMKYSCKLCIRDERADKEAEGPLYFQVLIERKKTIVNLKHKWSIAHFDKKTGSIEARQRGDSDFKLLETIISRTREKIYDIFRDYLIRDKELTTELFKKDYENYDNRNSFCSFMDLEIKRRYNINIISNQTYKNQTANYKTLLEYNKEVCFSEMDDKFLENYEAWLRNKKGYNVNTIHIKVRDIITYLNAAERNGIGINKKYKQYKKPATRSKIHYLTETELDVLKDTFYNSNLTVTHKNILRAFLFACYTGLRVSDWSRVTWDMVQENWLTFLPYKNRKFEKELKLPLPAYALQLLDTKRGKLLVTYSEQYMNRQLKDIGEAVGIKKDITTHMARHTFATRCVRKKIPIEVLQKYMGHSKIDKTMIYAHVENITLEENMQLLD